MQNLTLLECLFIWRTGSTRMRIGLALWLVGLRGMAVRVIEARGR